MAPKSQVAPAGSALDRLPAAGKVAVGLVFVLLAAAVYFVIFYGDLATSIEQATERETTLTAELARSELSKVEYQKDLEEKTRREQIGRDQKKVLPDASETPAFLATLQGIATIAGVSLTSWSPIEEVPMEFYAKVPMKLTLSGKFHQVAKFFNGVGQVDRIINVENIQIKSPKTDREDVEVQVECLATAFRAIGQDDAGSKRRGAGK
jgi:type IV pilus assembly protein PilO